MTVKIWNQLVRGGVGESCLRASRGPVAAGGSGRGQTAKGREVSPGKDPR